MILISLIISLVGSCKACKPDASKKFKGAGIIYAFKFSLGISAVVNNSGGLKKNFNSKLCCVVIGFLRGSTPICFYLRFADIPIP